MPHNNSFQRFLESCSLLLASKLLVSFLFAQKSMPGSSLPDVEEMAAMGNWGQNSNHIAEQMMLKYCQNKQLGLPEPYMVEAPVLVRNNADCAVNVVSKQIAVSLPHEWFAWLGSDKLTPELSEILTGLSGLGDFWKAHDKKDPKLANNPIRHHGRQNFLPLIVHGDGGSFQRCDSIQVVSMGSLLSAANVATSQLLLLALPKGCINKDDADLCKDTMTIIWQVFVWRFKALFLGKHPETDHQARAWPPDSQRKSLIGQPLHAAGCRGFIFALAGDGEWFQNEYKLKGYSFNECCFNCKANKSDCPFHDFRPTAKCRATKIAHNGTCSTQHLVASIPGVVGETFAQHSLHILEEGVAAHVLDNVFFDLVVKPGWPGTQDQKLRLLYEKIMRQYEELGTDSSNRISKLALSSFCNPKAKFQSFPVLSGIKARQIRYLVPAVLNICKDEDSADEPYTLDRTAVLESLELMYQLIDSGVMHFSSKQSQQYRKATDRLLQHYTKCCKMCMS